jgi:hypothetical protein
MLDQVFLDLIKGDFIKAIGKHAKDAQLQNEDIQIRIKIDAEEGLSYALYNKWKCVKTKCTFKEVMCFKLDVFGKEGMLSPHIYEMLLKQISEHQSDAEKFSVFLFERHKTICCSLHDGNGHVRACPLHELFT